MARTNYGFAKRQKEIERKKKQEEKRQRRQSKGKDDEEAAERRFFDRWRAMRGPDFDPLAIDRGAPPPTRGASDHSLPPSTLRGDIVFD